jgi:CRISPR-associated protein Cas4
MKISVSMLSSYLFCQRKLFLQKILALEEPPKENIVLGRIRHEVYDYINKSEENIVSSIKEMADFERLSHIYRIFYVKKVKEIVIKNKPGIREVNLNVVSVFRKTWPYIMEEANTRAKNIFSFMVKNNVYGKELWEELTPKIISEIKLESDKLQLKGIADKVEVYHNRYVPIELKTGKAPKEGMWPGHRIQIAAYAMLIEENFKTRVKEGFIHYLDAKEVRHVAINPFMKEEIIQLTGQVQELLEKSRIPDYCENRNKCTNCGLRKECYDENYVNILLEEIQNI